jgi:hypothetical protein
VSSFGRNDGSLVRGEEKRQSNGNDNGKATIAATASTSNGDHTMGPFDGVWFLVVTRFGLEQAESGRCVRGEKRWRKGDRYFGC